ncbi:hypothetical protein PENTCL1PPCAC_17714 [Pristionchus entomophagus]|uniref:Ground-like domain-containing protein n=1 Tax=Pristionchus entomophagus TaxID=358040 RepID=A0AAV5TMN0_9BILA|nr:hypothetical protein PENTCL1PPCAC_17714 [Pristionchus entomophagus]
MTMWSVLLLLSGLLLIPDANSLCCGRKKRSLSDYSNFHNLAARSDDVLCNSPDLKRILKYHMSNSTDSASSSLASITSALEASGERFVVLCALPGQSLSYSLPHEAEFCSASSSDHSCHIFTDPRHISNF